MPRVHGRVLLTLCLFAAAAIFTGGFVTFAPNRLARGVSYSLFEAPAPAAALAIAGLGGLALLSFVENGKLRSYAAIAASALVVWSTLEAAGQFAARLMSPALPAARASPGPAFWVLIAALILAIADALQRRKTGLFARLSLGAAFCSGFILMAVMGSFDDLSLAREFKNHSSVFAREVLRHLGLAAATMFFALMASMPLTFLVLRRAAAARLVFAALSILQTIPSIALFGVLIAPLSKLSEELPFLREIGVTGTGPAPALIALTLYALLPLVRAFYTGFAEVPPAVKDAAAGIGFGRREIFTSVELPLAMPALLSGLRTVTIQTIGLASVAALIGAGGLGTFIFQGIGQYAPDLVLIGAIPV
ncbi:MAG: ABC transporter permease, partial [Beijerinckiaceae bacterium]|nr:ABC transporter permease [Beijerinckiaceae bacterium]